MPQSFVRRWTALAHTHSAGSKSLNFLRKPNYLSFPLHPLPPDRGLYLPQVFPRLAPDELAGFAGKSYPEIAFDILRRYTNGILDDATLLGLCRDAYNFDVPIEPVYDRAPRRSHG
jgi:threonine synthase